MLLFVPWLLFVTGIAMKPEPIRARLIDANTAAAMSARLTALDPIAALCKRLVRDGYDPRLPMLVWRGQKPWRFIARIGAPDQMKFKGKSGGM